MVLKTQTGGTPAEKAPEPDLGQEIIAKERYTSREFMQLEWDRMWTKVWLMGGRLSDLPNVGDYLVEEIGSESVILVRSAPNELRGFYNVCPHRGNRLRHPGPGHAESFQCAYHFFEFELSGAKKFIPDEADFPQGCDAIQLKEIAVDTWGGWVWFSLNPDPEPLHDFLGMIPEHLDPYHIDEQYLVRDWTVEWNCNWKTSVDAFNESYHVQAIHPQLLEMMDDINIQIDLYDRHSRYLVPFGVLSPRWENQDEITDTLREMMRGVGIDPDEFTGTVQDVRPAIIEATRKRSEAIGIDFSEMTDNQLIDDFHYYIFPHVTFNTHANGVMVFRQRPHATDPDKMYFDLQNYTRLPEGADVPDRKEHEHFKHGEKSLGLVLDQDAYNLPRVQTGMHSAGYVGLHISKQERRLRHMHQTLDSYLADPDR